MAVGFAVAAVCSRRCCCSAASAGLAALADPLVLLLAVGVGVLSSVVPYVLDQIVLRRVGQARFAVLLALLPATATVVGLIALGQVPSPLEAVGIAAVVVAVACGRGTATRPSRWADRATITICDRPPVT